MTALRMVRRGNIKGRQLCRGAPWVIKVGGHGRVSGTEALAALANTGSHPTELYVSVT